MVVDRPDACASLARVLGEPLPGTAPDAVGWVLVEDHGPWGRDPLTEGRLPRALIHRLEAAIGDLPIRYQAIRRPGRSRGPDRTVFLAHGGPTPWMRRLTVPEGTLADLELPVAATLEGLPAAVGEPHHDPVVLVCTHAKRDACCAERGVAVGRAVAGMEPEATWETSHTGGHRFAPSVIMLPSGAIHGFMDETTTLAAVAAARDAELVLTGLRGRAAWPRWVQAAEVWARQRDGLTGLHDVVVEETVVEADVALVRLRLPARVVTIRVRRADLDARPQSCGAQPKPTDTWQVLDQVR